VTKFKVGDLITSGCSAGTVLEIVERDPMWKTSGVRIRNVPMEKYGGNADMSSFLADYIAAGWKIVPMDWVPVVGGGLEERYVWTADYSGIRRELRRTGIDT
jgi:hypothetical protein